MVKPFNVLLMMMTTVLAASLKSALKLVIQTVTNTRMMQGLICNERSQICY